MYRILVNNVEIDSTKIDQSTMQFKLATEETKFSAKASQLKLKFYGELILNYEKLNVIEVQDNFVRIWYGYAESKYYNYDENTDITTFTCYDWSKKTVGLWGSGLNYKFPLGLTVSELLQNVIQLQMNYSLSLLSVAPVTLTYDAVMSKSDQFSTILEGVDDNGNVFTVSNRSNNVSEPGVRLKLDNSNNIGIFTEAWSSDPLNSNYYFGIVDGAFCYYFSDTNGDRELFGTQAVRTADIYYEIKYADKIVIYSWRRTNTTTIVFQYQEVDWTGFQAASGMIVVDSNWPHNYYPSKKLVYSGSNLVVADGDGKVIDVYQDGDGYSCDLGDFDKFTYEGPLSNFYRFPYWYEETESDSPDLKRVLDDCAIFFDAYWTMYDGTIRMISETSSTNVSISSESFGQHKIKGIYPLEYDFSESGHPFYAAYLSKIQSYYSDKYGEYIIKYDLRFYYLNEITLLNKVNNMRTTQISKKDNYYTIYAQKGVK